MILHQVFLYDIRHPWRRCDADQLQSDRRDKHDPFSAEFHDYGPVGRVLRGPLPGQQHDFRG